MDRTPSPFYRDEEALRGLIGLCGQDLYGRSLLRTGNERIAKALSRRVILRLAELDRDTPLRYCMLLADAYLEQTLSEWELAMLQNSIRTGGHVPAAVTSSERGEEAAAPHVRGRSRAVSPRQEASAGSPENDAPAFPLADETPFPRSRKSARKERPVPVLPEEDEEYEEDAYPEDSRVPGWLIALLSALCLFLLWLALGLFMRMGALPFLDLGYRFFNARVLPLF